MSTNIVYTKGDFHCFIATVAFYAGGIEKQIQEGEQVWFDGYVMDFGDGVNISYPKLKAAISQGWLSLVDSGTGRYVNNYRPKDDNMKLAPAASNQEAAFATMSEDDNVVGQVKTAKQITDENKASWKKPSALVEPESGHVHAIAMDNIEDMFSNTSKSEGKPTQTKLVDTRGNDNLTFRGGSVIEDASASGKILGTVEDFSDATKLAQKTASLRESEPLSDRVEKERNNRKAQLLASKTVSDQPASVDWDLSVHWTKRVKNAVELWGGDSQGLKAILEMETPAVKKRIKQQLNLD